MSVVLNINGTDYFYPQTGDANWGPDATDWAVAVTQGMLQKAGGLFQLLGEVDFGPNYGLKSIYYKSRSSNISSTGTLRLARTDVIGWRNNANDNDLLLSVDSSDQLLYNGSPIGTMTTVSDTNSIDLTITGTDLTADLNLSADTADSGYTLTSLSIEVDGLKAQTPEMVGDSGSGGSSGTVPAPQAGDAAANKFLKADGTWSVTPTSNLTFSNTNSINLDNTADVITADLNLSSDPADAGYTLTDLSIESDGLKAQTPEMVGDSGSGGASGTVPAPTAGDAAANKFLKADGTWEAVAAGSLSWFGPGSDGNATITSSISLSRDMYYNNLTISGAGSLNAAGYRIFVKGTLDLTGASANAIRYNSTPGNNASGATAGAQKSGTSGSQYPTCGQQTGRAGGNGSTTNGSSATGAGASVYYIGGYNSTSFPTNSGKGGAGASGTGGNQGPYAVTGTTPWLQVVPTAIFNFPVGVGTNQPGAAQSTSVGGGGGGGDGTNSGGGGGGAGPSGGALYIAANIVLTNGAAASAISAAGAAGGNGANGVAGNTGGGGGGQGGQGGYIYFLYNVKGDAAATDVLDCSGGNGGTGGTGSGTGGNGNGGAGGPCGTIVLIRADGSAAPSITLSNAAYTAHSGTTGGTGYANKVTF